MTDYSKMNDIEINNLVFDVIQGRTPTLLWGKSRRYLDFCNNPAEALPIIVENRITLLWIEKTSIWCAAIGGLVGHDYWGWDESPEMYSENINPLRAAMIVFLMMNEAGNV